MTIEFTILLSVVIFTGGLAYGLHQIAEAISYAGWIQHHVCVDEDEESK